MLQIRFFENRDLEILQNSRNFSRQNHHARHLFHQSFKRIQKLNYGHLVCIKLLRFDLMYRKVYVFLLDIHTLDWSDRFNET